MFSDILLLILFLTYTFSEIGIPTLYISTSQFAVSINSRTAGKGTLLLLSIFIIASPLNQFHFFFFLLLFTSHSCWVHIYMGKSFNIFHISTFTLSLYKVHFCSSAENNTPYPTLQPFQFVPQQLFCILRLCKLSLTPHTMIRFARRPILLYIAS